MTPYSYLLHHKPTNKFYYGVRYAKGCDPKDFWVKYFTSSKFVELLRTLFGDDCWEFEIRRTFDSVEAARNWEHIVLRRMKVMENHNIWLNQTDNKSMPIFKMFGDQNPMRRSEIALKHSGTNCSFHRPEMKKLISKDVRNRVWITNGKIDKRIHKDSVIPKGFRLGRIVSWNTRPAGGISV